METVPLEVDDLELVKPQLSFLVRSRVYVKYQLINDKFAEKEAEYILQLNDENRREYFDRFSKTIFFKKGPNRVRLDVGYKLRFNFRHQYLILITQPSRCQ